MSAAGGAACVACLCAAGVIVAAARAVLQAGRCEGKGGVEAVSCSFVGGVVWLVAAAEAWRPPVVLAGGCLAALCVTGEGFVGLG